MQRVPGYSDRAFGKSRDLKPPTTVPGWSPYAAQLYDPSLAAIQAGLEAMNQWRDLVEMVVEGLSPTPVALSTPGRSYRSPNRMGPSNCCESAGCTCAISCAPSHCHCQCCICDADLVVYAHLGERRVVPITIENNRRRERDVRLQLGPWTSRGGRPCRLVEAAVQPDEEFVLAPCSERTVMLLIQVGGPAGERDAEKLAAERTPVKEMSPRTLLDVDQCEVCYADLSIIGCDARPIRIAVAVLPRDCGAFTVNCCCGCC